MTQYIVDFVKNDPATTVIFVLFIISEILGSCSKIQSNSIYQLIESLLKRLLAITPLGPFLGLTNTQDPPKDPQKNDGTK